MGLMLYPEGLHGTKQPSPEAKVGSKVYIAVVVVSDVNSHTILQWLVV
jgi:hypothetical protein